jgi:hypothetical protein
VAVHGGDRGCRRRRDRAATRCFRPSASRRRAIRVRPRSRCRGTARCVLVRGLHPGGERGRTSRAKLGERVQHQRAAETEAARGAGDGELLNPPAPVAEDAPDDPPDRAPVAARAWAAARCRVGDRRRSAGGCCRAPRATRSAARRPRTSRPRDVRARRATQPAPLARARGGRRGLRAGSSRRPRRPSHSRPRDRRVRRSPRPMVIDDLAGLLRRHLGRAGPGCVLGERERDQVGAVGGRGGAEASRSSSRVGDRESPGAELSHCG